MRKGISKAERRKAMRAAEKHALANYWGWKEIPEFLASGAFNVVYALSADLVLRIQCVPGEEEEDTSWDFYEAAQLYPHPALPTVWELGEFKGHKFAIVERMECTLRALVARGRLPMGCEASRLYAVEHLLNVTKRVVYDTHDSNIMKRRKKDEFVLVDCLLD